MPYYSPGGGGGGATPGGTDSQVQVNSQNLLAGYPNFRWINTSNELNLNSAGRIRKGGVAEVDGVQPTGVTGMVWLDTSSSFVPPGTIAYPLAVASGGTALVATGSALTLLGVNSNGSTLEYKVLTPGSSVSITYQNSGVTISAITGAGGGNKAWENYYLGPNTGMFTVTARRLLVAGQVNNTAHGNGAIVVNNTAFCYPLFIARSIQIDSMSCNVVTGGSASQIQLGIYTNSADNIPFPFQVIATSGYLSGSNNAVRPAFATTQILSSNTLYWLVYVSQIGTSNVITLGQGASFPIFGSQDGIAVATTPASLLNIAMVGTLPATMIGSGLPSTGVGPVLYVHITG